MCGGELRRLETFRRREELVASGEEDSIHSVRTEGTVSWNASGKAQGKTHYEFH